MTGKFPLDWAVMAVSLFNTILLLWLGLTVLLNADYRVPGQAQKISQSKRWGIWLAGGGLLMGGAFFVSHSAILAHSLNYAGQGMSFWWRVGWIPVVASPFAWYALMLWYAGYWEHKISPLRRRQRFWFLLTLLLAIGSIVLRLFANPLPSYWQATQLKLSAAPSIAGIPLLIVVYPLYIVLCISLSLDALRPLEAFGQMMGDLARRRARPWLMAASVTLLLVSLLVAWVMVWIALNARQQTLHGVYSNPSPALRTGIPLTVAWFDLSISTLIAIAVVFLGRAIISYEVFTGKILPRRGFFRRWRSAVILAAGYGLLVGWGLAFHLRSAYSLLLTTILMTFFYALFSWRSYAEREQYIANLRPFVASQRLYERLLTPSASFPSQGEIATPFHALCRNVLNARLAYLVPLGSLAPLVGPALVYPAGAPTTPPALTELWPQFDSPQAMYLPLDPVRYNGARWAVSLWSERGLIGVFLLGEKRDRGLYTQEEIEIARASGERLIDAQASAEMARRLMALQRQRLAETQVLDRQARRTLHDDILPRLHTAMLTLNSGDADPAVADAVELLAGAHHQISDLLREMPAAVAPEVAHLGLIGALRQLAENELASAFDEVVWQIEPEAARKEKTLPPLTAEVLFYAAREVIRNAARYGRGDDATRPLHLRIKAAWQAARLEILIEDNGVGLGVENQPRARGGHGLALHSTMMAVVGGTLTVESVPNQYTRVLLILPELSGKIWH